MLNINLENIKKQKESFRQLLGEEFIRGAEEYSQLYAQGELKQQPKGYTPFFDFWHSYNLDIETSQKQKQLVLSPRTYFLFDLLDQLYMISDLPNFLRIVKKLRVKNTFYSAAYEASVAALYKSFYSLNIIEEGNSKSPDLLRCHRLKKFISNASLWRISPWVRGYFINNFSRKLKKHAVLIANLIRLFCKHQIILIKMLRI